MTATVRPASGHKIRYMPALDGLRALSVIAVLFYHAQISWIPGGFLGVEVFFTISGFLITRLLLTELGDSGTIDFKDFWIRRARRLLPAVVVLLAAIVAFTAIFLPGELAEARRDALAALSYVTNWFLIVQDVSYFEAFGRPSFTQHLWSLAIEEQFYLIWPLVMLFGARFLGKWGLFAFIMCGIVGSTALMWSLYVPLEDPSRIYYGTDTRAAGLLVGAALAMIWPHAKAWTEAVYRSPRRLGKNLLGVTSLALLIYLNVNLSEFDDRLYQGGFLIVSLTTAAVIAGTVGRTTFAGRLLSIPLLRWIGQRSYGIYLWHWPVYQLTRPGVDVQFDGIRLLALRLAITFLLAEVSYVFIETPIRRYGLVEAARRAVKVPSPARLGLATSAIVLVIATVGALTVDESSEADNVSAAGPNGVEVTEVGEVAAGDLPAGGASAGAVDAPAAVTPDPAAGPTAQPTTEPRVTAAPEDPVAEPTATPDDGADPPAPEDPAAAPGDAAPEEGPAAEPGAAQPTAAPQGGAEQPAVEATPPPELPTVTALGDSVMVGAQEELLARFGERVSIHASVAMQFKDGVAVGQQLAASGELGDVVVVHLGTNGVINDDLFDQMMAALAPADHVVFLSVRVPRRWEEVVNDTIRSGVERYPKAHLADWHGLSDGRDELFVADQVHLKFSGQELYADLVAQTVNSF